MYLKPTIDKTLSTDSLEGNIDFFQFQILTAGFTVISKAPWVISLAFLQYSTSLKNSTGTFTGAQLTGETLNLTETAAGTSNLIINVGSGTTASFTNLTASTFTSGSDTVTINGAGGNENITGPNVASTINGYAGADTIVGGSANDTKQYFMKASPVRPGDYLEFFAETDLLGALSACPGGDCGSEHSSDIAKCYPLKVSIWTVNPKYLNDIKPSAISNYNRNHGID